MEFTVEGFVLSTMFAEFFDVFDVFVLVQTGQKFASKEGGGLTVLLGYAMCFGAVFEFGCMFISGHDLVQVFLKGKQAPLLGPKYFQIITIGNLVLLAVLLFGAVCARPFCDNTPVPIEWVLVHLISTVVTFVAGTIGSKQPSRPEVVGDQVLQQVSKDAMGQVIGVQA